MPDIVCISPVDGREVVRRAASSAAEIEAASRPRARRRPSGSAYRSRSAEKSSRKAVDAMLAMRDEIAPELAWQMGRPVRYGGGELNGFEERARAMIALAETRAGADRSRAEAGLQALRRARAGRHRAHRRAVELSLSHRGQFRRAGADGRQRRDPEARRADAAGRRSLPAGDGPRGPAEGSVPHADAVARRHHQADRLGRGRPDLLHRLGRGRQDDRARGGRNVRGRRPRARRQGPGLCAARRRPETRDRERGRRRVFQFRAMLLRHRARLRARRRLRHSSSMASPT